VGRRKEAAHFAMPARYAFTNVRPVTASRFLK
jgi:hypothetical protein